MSVYVIASYDIEDPEVLMIVLLILLIAITSLLLASCPVDQPLIVPPERRAETSRSSKAKATSMGLQFDRFAYGGLSTLTVHSAPRGRV